ncbi:hypothetical protein G7K_5263-t1 [Saitoella complicata NRRL Y-17804]|uniref:Uncharacterized protein n=1 Tax=Saitoella complicata (strain BCRC 22490 / CBS 7301 / JCM 7358 / NBRC 10748 / NRRL Y-17804) TaxID=698492 RepID=A0A0E9NMP6_SAICN|nr:hypothetical protein G7K_5263-t1 [Saitoella complicata NRRL Y-17804]
MSIITGWQAWQQIALLFAVVLSATLLVSVFSVIRNRQNLRKYEKAAAREQAEKEAIASAVAEALGNLELGPKPPGTADSSYLFGVRAIEAGITAGIHQSPRSSLAEPRHSNGSIGSFVRPIPHSPRSTRLPPLVKFSPLSSPAISSFHLPSRPSVSAGGASSSSIKPTSSGQNSQVNRPMSQVYDSAVVLAEPEHELPAPKGLTLNPNYSTTTLKNKDPNVAETGVLRPRRSTLQIPTTPTTPTAPMPVPPATAPGPTSTVNGMAAIQSLPFHEPNPEVVVTDVPSVILTPNPSDEQREEKWSEFVQRDVESGKYLGKKRQSLRRSILEGMTNVGTVLSSLRKSS